MTGTPRTSPLAVTPKEVFLSRRSFLRQAGFLGAAGLLAACSASPQATDPAIPSQPAATPTEKFPAGSLVDELGNPTHSYKNITTINNYYEFSFVKNEVHKITEGLPTSPWSVQVGGLVSRPQAFSLEDLVKAFPPEERVYRLRCVETWSMVVPWQGFPLASLLETVQPLPEAKYVRFETAYLEDEMPNLSNQTLPWPYTEGLRLDEAMHDLTILATGLYGEPLPLQNGGPIRLVVPWKYGFKSAKSLVKIDLVERQPDTFWSSVSPEEYGFFANVNPGHPHPRWSQSTELPIGERLPKPTLLFNGYEDQVAGLYTGMNLDTYY